MKFLIYPKISLEICSPQLPLAGNPPTHTHTHATASHSVCMCVLSLYTLYLRGMLRHSGGGGGGENSLQLNNEKKR